MTELGQGPGPGKIENSRVIFPLFSSIVNGGKIRRQAFLGTAFFISRAGLAITATHVLESAGEGLAIIAGLSKFGLPVSAYSLDWVVGLPNSDIAVMRVATGSSPCLLVEF